MKLTRTKILEVLRKKNMGETSYQARKLAGISVRRVDQVWKKYKETGNAPKIGLQNGRPKKSIEQWEIDLVKETYTKYRVSADTLERIIDKNFGKHIGHNRINNILIQLGFAKFSLVLKIILDTFLVSILSSFHKCEYEN